MFKTLVPTGLLKVLSRAIWAMEYENTTTASFHHTQKDNAPIKSDLVICEAINKLNSA